MKRDLFLLSAFLALPACPPSPVTPQPDADSAAPAPAIDASVDDAGDIDEMRRPKRDALAPTTECGRACAQFSWLGCQEGSPTPKGETCESVCLKSNAFPGVKLPTACVIGAQSIAAVRKCGVACK